MSQKHDDFTLQVQASLAANTFAVTGHAENKQITELLPGILNQVRISFIILIYVQVISKIDSKTECDFQCHFSWVLNRLHI